MSVAQRLYEAGRITYMRTDSVNLSDTALQGAEQEIKSAYGDTYHKRRQYRTKSAGAQEAHEAIRPTYFDQHTIGADNAERSEEHTSELQSLMRISYAVFCLKKKKPTQQDK